MKTIYHYSGCARNYGDMALAYSMRYYIASGMNKHYGESVQFVPLEMKLDSPITKETIDLINATGDALIVGGGGLVMKGDGFDTRSGWQFNVSRTDLLDLRVPLIVYSIGYNEFPYGDTMPYGVADHLKTTQIKAELMSARDPGSAKAMQRLGLKNIRVTPDPGMFCPSWEPTLPNIATGEQLIALNLAGDRHSLRFDDGKSPMRFYEEVAVALRRLCRDRQCRVVWVPHVTKYDNELKWVVEGILGDYFYDVSEKLPWLYPEQMAYAPIIKGIYAQCRMTVGMRGHANILSFGAGVPYLAVGDHDKNISFAEYTGGRVARTSDDIEVAIHEVFDDTGYAATLRERSAELLGDFMRFNSEIEDVIS